MEIEVDKLLAQGFSLRLPPKQQGQPERTVLLGPSGGLAGRYRSDRDSIVVRAVTAPVLRITKLCWTVGSAVVRAEQTITLERVAIDVTIPRSDDANHGTVRIGKLSAPQLIVDLRGMSEPIVLSGTELHNVELVLSEHPLRATSTAGAIEALTLALDTGTTRKSIETRAERIAFPEGIQLHGSHVDCPRLELPSLHLDIRSLHALLARDKSEPTDAARNDASAKTPTDWSLLDKVKGRFDVDLTADATVPVIGRRKATHRFRVPIADGTINFKELESGLARLEDAVLDFAVRDDKLVFEKDLPLVPFDTKTLVYWALPPQELLLARRKRVRLSRLIRWQLPKRAQPKSGPAGKSAIDLRRLDINGIEIDLSMAAGGTLETAGGSIHFGARDDHALEALEIRGALRHKASGALEPTSVQVQMRALELALASVQLGSTRLDTQLRVAAIERASVAFDGFRPGNMTATVLEVVFTQLKTRSAAGSST